jgi:PHD/YefM family antitoxin component YafN of YafNO toxin-antitoxin module
MINFDNIHSFQDFERNAQGYVDQIRDRKEPIVLTINGEAALILHEAKAFQAMVSHLQAVEEELQQLKLEMLRKEIELGLGQIQAGEAIPADQVFSRLRDRSQALRQQQ